MDKYLQKKFLHIGPLLYFNAEQQNVNRQAPTLPLIPRDPHLDHLRRLFPRVNKVNSPLIEKSV